MSWSGIWPRAAVRSPSFTTVSLPFGESGEYAGRHLRCPGTGSPGLVLVGCLELPQARDRLAGADRVPVLAQRVEPGSGVMAHRVTSAVSRYLRAQGLLQAGDRAVQDAVVARLRHHARQVKVLQGFQRVGVPVPLDTGAITSDGLQDRDRL